MIKNTYDTPIIVEKMHYVYLDVSCLTYRGRQKKKKKEKNDMKNINNFYTRSYIRYIMYTKFGVPAVCTYNVVKTSFRLCCDVLCLLDMVKGN